LNILAGWFKQNPSGKCVRISLCEQQKSRIACLYFAFTFDFIVFEYASETDHIPRQMFIV